MTFQLFPISTAQMTDVGDFLNIYESLMFMITEIQVFR